MKRTLLYLVSLLCLLAQFAASADTAFREGVDYVRIVPAQPTSDPARIEVVELFWYGCPHCHRFQPYLERWLEHKPKDVAYVRMPAILRDSWALLARAFYTSQVLGRLDELHKPLFDAIHKEKRKLNDEAAVAAFFAEHGVDAVEFRKVFHSFAVDSKVRRALQMTRRYRVQGTPSIVVNGKYLTDPGMARGFDRMIQVMDYLVARERKAGS
ncbi:MAG TPA: thiol:disulfide interchange protein DsbA/DsbL [Gammaproteobacteria bacterium]|nr:thiol:disulfide interchange protein DsbA/DsbL [Gammaproteobacteria bacterium]